MVESVRGDVRNMHGGVRDVERGLRDEIRENRRESTREHTELDKKFTDRFDATERHVSERFDRLDERDRRRLRAMFE